MSIVLLILGYLAFFAVLRFEKYNHMLIANVFSGLLVGAYLYLNGAIVGGTVSSIAGLASVAQLTLGHIKVEGQQNLKNLIASLFTVVAVMILYNKPSDLLPCIAFTQNRLFEAQGKPQLIRLGAFFGTLLWAVYAFTHELYILAIIELTISGYAAFMLLKPITRAQIYPRAQQAS